jgi:predicted ABC-type ATPase
MTQSPWLWLIAGPNGSGKSTYAPNLSSEVEEIVRPDELAYQLSLEKPESVALKAGRLAINRIESLLEEKRSFAVETTLSGRFHLAAATRAKSYGWNIGIVYIGLSSPIVAIGRVRLRKLRGGHNVPPADVRRRYRRSLVNLATIYGIADRLVILDTLLLERR